MSVNQEKIVRIIEASLLAAGSSLSKDRMLELFAEEEKVKAGDITKAVEQLQAEAENRGVELVEVATGFRYQARQEYAEWIARLWEERPSRYSRALLETLSLIAYRQPATRSDIEQVRGVGVSSSIIKTLLEREWIRVVGHRDVPGKPALYATTKQFLDYFGLKSLDELPSLSEIKDLDNLNPELQFDDQQIDAEETLQQDVSHDQESEMEASVEHTSEDHIFEEGAEEDDYAENSTSDDRGDIDEAEDESMQAANDVAEEQQDLEAEIALREEIEQQIH